MSFDMARDTTHGGDCLGTLCPHCDHCVHSNPEVSCRCSEGGCGCDAYSPPDGLGQEPDTLTPAASPAVSETLEEWGVRWNADGGSEVWYRDEAHRDRHARRLSASFQRRYKVETATRTVTTSAWAEVSL